MLWSAILVVGGCGSPNPAAAQESTLGKILTDQRLWGEDAFATFSLLDQWKRVGAPSIIVFSDRVASGTPMATPEEAKKGAAAMAPAKKRARKYLQPAYTAQYRGAMEERIPRLSASASQFLEDGSYRVVWTAPEGEFLKRELKVQTVVDAYGVPEAVTSETIHFEGERRPLILTKYSYAGGAIQFIQSNLEPTPGLVNRAIIELEPAITELYGP